MVSLVELVASVYAEWKVLDSRVGKNIVKIFRLLKVPSNNT